MDGDRFYERQINGTQVLIQENRLRVWHGYVAQKWRVTFTDKRQAQRWLENYALADVQY